MLVDALTYLSRRKGKYLQKEREVRAQISCSKAHKNFCACLQSMHSRTELCKATEPCEAASELLRRLWCPRHFAEVTASHNFHIQEALPLTWTLSSSSVTVSRFISSLPKSVPTNTSEQSPMFSLLPTSLFSITSFLKKQTVKHQ